MKPLGETKRHFWLAQRMAKLHDVDLVGAVARGDLAQEEWAGMVTRCRGCEWTEGCTRFLEQGEAHDDLPHDCRNRVRMAELLALQTAATQGEL
ncbi:DUF6455 family protein [Rhodalgimonas zhirmunskyi]|uniref:DUF6455 family protein n=1 Tax=Rhodalgimonas zhirmunskyi TaxID=2964767 RepID=A0AAJ1U998_9RHOB|nr:DUF6455 family protein [Rhodoalgimonas zhirmunskyi]MDQ2095671.1 DUF6455 family protein [Rhodoalgimonas zhirmunskyi]